MAGEWSVTARNGRGRERPRCAANTSPGEHGSSQHAKIHTPKLRAHAKRKRTLAILAPAGYLRMVYTAAERSRRTRGAGQSRRGVQPTEWLRHAHEARGRRKRGVRTVHSIHRRAPPAPRAMQHGKTYMYASPGVQTLCADECEDQVVHKPWSRGVCMGTRPLPGLGDASARRATHRMTAARARGARQVQTGHTHSAQYIATPREPARNAAPCNPPRPPSPHLGDIYLAYISPVHLAKGSNKRGSPGGTIPESTLSARAPRDFRNIAPRVSNPRLRKWWMRP